MAYWLFNSKLLKHSVADKSLEKTFFQRAFPNIIDKPDTGDTGFNISHVKHIRDPELREFFRKACDKAGLYHCSGLSLRSGGATLASESGATTKQIMAIFRWADIKHAEHYAKKARIW